MELRQRKKIKNGMPAYDLGLVQDQYITNWLQKFGPDKISGSPAMNAVIKRTTLGNTDLTGYKPKPTGGNQSTSGGGSGGADIAGITQGALGFAGAMMNAWGPVKSTNELLADAGTSNQSIMGVSYTAQNNVDEGALKKQANAETANGTLQGAASGAMLGGSIVPGWGHAVGAVVGGIAGLFGGKSRKKRLMKRIQNAKDLASRTNNYNQASAMSTGLQQNYYLNNDYTQDDVLYG